MPFNYGYFGNADSDVPVWFNYVYCSSGNSRLENCYRSLNGPGNHDHDVGVRCKIGECNYVNLGLSNDIKFTNY